MNLAREHRTPPCRAGPLRNINEWSNPEYISEKGFPDELSCNRSLKWASSRLSELLRFGYCQTLAWASIHVPDLENFAWARYSSLERTFKCSSWVCSLKRGPARLSEHSSWQSCKNCDFCTEHKISSHKHMQFTHQVYSTLEIRFMATNSHKSQQIG